MADRSEQTRQQVGHDNRSTGEVINAVVAHTQELVRSEIRLAKTEIQEDITSAGKAAAMLAAGGVAGLYALGLFLLTAVWVIGTQIELWISALIVTAVVGAIAGILLAVGFSKFKKLNPKPEKTMESVKEDAEWAKRQTP